MDNEKCIDSFHSEYKVSFMKKIAMYLCIYDSHIACKGVGYDGEKINFSESMVDIGFEKIANLDVKNIDGIDWLIIYYKYETLLSGNNTAYIAFYRGKNINVVKDSIIKSKDKYIDSKIRERNSQIKFEQKAREKALKAESDAKEFYDNCYSFHIKEHTPIFQLQSEQNRISVIYLSDDRSINFLLIDGYKKVENHGVILFDEIHYYEKAGNVHYVSEINGHYNSFGGSFTGGDFSKLAALGGGFLFGAMGMAAGAMLTYKPAKMEPTKTTFDIDSETHKIDDRSVILNFYSEAKKEYVDLELPQNIYNFMQTYLPEKKYDVVMELEKNTAIKNSSKILNPPSPSPALPQNNADDMTIFKQKVEKLKLMYDAGILTDEEFQKEKLKLLANI